MTKESELLDKPLGQVTISEFVELLAQERPQQPACPDIGVE